MGNAIPGTRCEQAVTVTEGKLYTQQAGPEAVAATCRKEVMLSPGTGCMLCVVESWTVVFTSGSHRLEKERPMLRDLFVRIKLLFPDLRDWEEQAPGSTHRWEGTVHFWAQCVKMFLDHMEVYTLGLWYEGANRPCVAYTNDPCLNWIFYL